MNLLLKLTALIEAGAGLALLGFPSLAMNLLFGSTPVEPALSALGRMTGAALLALAVACWLAGGDARGRAARGVVAGMLVYNIAVVAIFTLLGLGGGPHGVLLWPAVGLHTVMSVWCLAKLAGPREPKPKESS